MPRPRLPYLNKEVSRHGRVVWYVRRGKGARIRLQADFGTDEFKAEYEAAIAGQAAPAGRGKAKAGSLRWLFDRYRETTDWARLAPSTRRARENVMWHVLESAGDVPFAAISREHIEAGKNRRRDTPHQARTFLDCMRRLYLWALTTGLAEIDPTAGVKNPKPRASQGFPVWTEEDIERYYARWPQGTRERVWIDVLLFTGLRRGDAVRIGRQHVKDGIATLKTEKSGYRTEVTIPILPTLMATLKAGPTGDLSFICNSYGEPFVKEAFGNAFHDAARAAGVQKSAHGLRKAGATRAADNGATEAELEAIFGWHGGRMASLYTRTANRRRLAKQAIGKLVPGN